MSPAKEKEPMLKKSITLAEALGLTFTVMGFLIGFYVNIQIRLHDLETARSTDNQDRTEIKQDLKEIKSKLENMELELKDKADRQDSK